MIENFQKSPERDLPNKRLSRTKSYRDFPEQNHIGPFETNPIGTSQESSDRDLSNRFRSGQFKNVPIGTYQTSSDRDSSKTLRSGPTK